MKKLKKLLLTIIICSMTLQSTGCLKSQEGSSQDEFWYELQEETNLKNGMYYIKTSKGVYYPLYKGDSTFDDELPSFNDARRVSKYSLDVDKIPTFHPGDKIVYIEKKEVLQEVHWEKFEDLGYSVGISGLKENLTGRYDVEISKSNIHQHSTAVALLELGTEVRVVIDNVGGVKLVPENISRAGSILGVKKDLSYAFDFYIGTNHYPIELIADTKVLVSEEIFKSYEYKYTDENYVEIYIPENLDFGYYMVNGIGMFRYTSEERVEKAEEIIEGNKDSDREEMPNAE